MAAQDGNPDADDKSLPPHPAVEPWGMDVWAPAASGSLNVTKRGSVPGANLFSQYLLFPERWKPIGLIEGFN